MHRRCAQRGLYPFLKHEERRERDEREREEAVVVPRSGPRKKKEAQTEPKPTPSQSQSRGVGPGNPVDAVPGSARPSRRARQAPLQRVRCLLHLQGHRIFRGKGT